MQPTVILTNARIYTVDQEFSRAEALAIQGDRILACGSRAEVLEAAGPGADIVDMGGRTILPGFIEAHGHPTAEMNFTGPEAIDIRASVRGSAEAVMTALREAVATAEQAGNGGWVAAFGWDPLLLPDLPAISGRLLTEISPNVPLSVMHYSAHSAWTNRSGMERLGIDRDTPDPGASQYLRDATGEPTGEALELPAAMNLMGPLMEATEDNFGHLLEHTLRGMSRAGVTTTGDLAFHPENYPLMHRYQQQRQAPVRIRAYEMSGARPQIPASRPADGVDEQMFRPVGVKVWTDGSPWVGNIETSFGYEDSPATRSIGIVAGHRGCSNYTREQLWAICREHYGNGWQMACHVHGDIAVDMVLDVVAEIQEEFPRSDSRFRLEHCGTITPAQVARAHELGVTISFFVAHIHYYGDILHQLFGERANTWTPAKAAKDVGMRFSLHNDPPVTPESPLLNMQAAVMRRAPSGRILGAEQCIELADAVRAQTIDAAWQLFSDHEVGSLEPGKLADLVVLETDPFSVPAEEIGAITVSETWLGGVPAHQLQHA